MLSSEWWDARGRVQVQGRTSDLRLDLAMDGCAAVLDHVGRCGRDEGVPPQLQWSAGASAVNGREGGAGRAE